MVLRRTNVILGNADPEYTGIDPEFSRVNVAPLASCCTRASP